MLHLISKDIRWIISYKYRLLSELNSWLHCVVIFSGPQGPLTVSIHLKMEFRSCARGCQWCGIFHYHWWTASIKLRLLFSHSGLNVSWGLPFLQFIQTKPLEHSSRSRTIGHMNIRSRAIFWSGGNKVSPNFARMDIRVICPLLSNWNGILCPWHLIFYISV